MSIFRPTCLYSLVYPTPAVSHLRNSPRLNMQFSNFIKLATFLAASGFALGSPAPGEIMHEARTVTLGSFCTGPGSSGCIPFTRPSLPSGCVNNSPGFINNISFYTINAGFKCTWFNFVNCGGDAITTTGPASVNLAQTNFDNNLESYSCNLTRET
ncbi:hypothetical protein C8J57DRAFT_1524016 [Mycena rebaudengoi]|nr:hypothetical protein C8J57DRAFT_1524016 [Mycena rebaudengoi]